ncbi:WS/DGAT domain-containing protein [Amycolatopsis sp. NPDC051903]
MTRCAFSYAGQVRFCLDADRRLLPDPEDLVRSSRRRPQRP